ncbi:uncharacterized protein LOC133533794 [Cydia pomonella]|uniref:uncharacterized protein LOC133518400 n=1 Tax=Cydia pomonella TaxID=82600 RepID=UPI002ADE5BA9|nr:uncharacterized protein LOC133518400 [Cydia pomonella]XP_061728829.1 uncharacterized protein LOC133533794 [Cydia pomonella]
MLLSPIARSLLALAVLLAAADAQTNCKTVLFGVATNIPINFTPAEYQAGGARLYMDNECQKQQRRMLAGELVTACDYSQYGVAPDISEVYPPQFSPVDVRCPDGCPGGGVTKIVQYCY